MIGVFGVGFERFALRCRYRPVRFEPVITIRPADAAPASCSASSSLLCPASTPTSSCSTSCILPWMAGPISCAGRERTLPLSLGGALSICSKCSRVLPLPLLPSTTRSLTIFVCLGMAFRAASSLSAFSPDLRIYHCSSGVAHSSPVNCSHATRKTGGMT